MVLGDELRIFLLRCTVFDILISVNKEVVAMYINDRAISFLLPIVLLIMPCPVSEARTIYVDDDAIGLNDGTSWVDAYTFLQEALNDARLAEKPVEIRVAQDIYRPNEGLVAIPEFDWRTTTFQLINGVTLKGGYAGLGQPDPNARDVELYETILSGDLNGDDADNVDVADPEYLLDVPGRAENSYHVVTGSSTDGMAVLDGFTITAGNANGSSAYGNGAGLYNLSGSPTLTNCTFRGNSAWNGGGMYNRISNPNITNCKFSTNSAIDGGGICNSLYSSPVLKNCRFIGNLAYNGAGMDNNHYCHATLMNCTFTGSSVNIGGGMNNDFSNPILANCAFIGNSAREGAGMHNHQSHPILTNCMFTGNKALSGGGMDNENSSHPSLTNCTFSGNMAEIGNALMCDIYGHNPNDKYPGIIDLNNCIIWDSGNEIWNENGSTINITHSNIPNKKTTIYDPFGAVIWGDGNIHTDPLFVDADGDDNMLGTSDDNPRLSENSPCIDAGDNSMVPPSLITDIDGKMRIVNDLVDIGAFERQAPYFQFGMGTFVVLEGKSETFTIALTELPSDTVTVTVAFYSGDRDIRVKSGEILVFDSSNYSVPQTFALSADEDSDNLNGIARIRISTPNLSVDVRVTEADNEPNVGILFVDDDAPDGGNGTSWAEAYTFLQDALADARLAEKPVEIRVAQGIYWPDQGGDYVVGDKIAIFRLVNGVAIKGGFAGIGETDPDKRDIEIYQTILSGDLAGNDSDANDFVVLPNEPTRTDNSYHVVTGGGTTNTAVLDGFIVIGGNATYSYQEEGGGIYIIAGNPTITNCTFIYNWGWSGGGLYNGNSSPVLTNCVFSMNSGLDGAGMYNTNSNPMLFNCIFTENATAIPPGVIVEPPFDNGGGMYNRHSSPVLTNCTFVGNSAFDVGGIYNYGDADSTLIDCILWGNTMPQIVGNAVISYSNVQGGWEGEGNIDADPIFADPNNGDYHLKSQKGRFDPNIQTWIKDDITSPCIDAGNPNSPVVFEPFPNGGIVNMGAYGGTAQASKSPSDLHAKYGGGSGEPNNPYLIYTTEQMNTIGLHSEDRDSHFKLMADIDLSGLGARDFNIIGTFPNYFRGVFDGNGHTISNFTCISTDVEGIALFSYVEGGQAEIRDLGLIDPVIDAGMIEPDGNLEEGNTAGSLVNYLWSGTVSRCYVRGGSVSGDLQVGGLVAYNRGGVLAGCYSSAEVIGSNGVGGLVGHNKGTITGCHAIGTVTGLGGVGGLTGYNEDLIQNSSASGDVAGDFDIGGLVGESKRDKTIQGSFSTGGVTGIHHVGGLVGNSLSDVTNCYSTSSVSGGQYVGGLVGFLGGLIADCYSAGNIIYEPVESSESNPRIGGLVGLGYDPNDVHSSFWDIEASGQTVSFGGTGKTTAEMQTANTFLEAGWDFINETDNGTDDIWWILEGRDYPHLWWERSQSDGETVGQ